MAWRQFSDLPTDLLIYFEQTTNRIVTEAICADTRDAETTLERRLLS